MPLSLVILAAGLGTRSGGPQQLAPVGPADETLLDYTVFDAHRAGFRRVVFVIRQDMVRSFHPFASRFRGPLEVHLAHQHIADAPKGARVAGRTRPWGTAHAVLVAAPHVAGPFAVCSADDFYGAEAFRAAAEFLEGRPKPRTTWGLVGYPLGDTRSGAGPVSRTVCRVDGDGWLTDLVATRVGPDDGAGDSKVSMNFWCFTQEVFPVLESAFEAFSMAAGADEEFVMTEVVRDAVREGMARVRVLSHASRWLGVTAAEDVEGVRAELSRLTKAGVYPSPLWP